jgi:hypothetical protein
LPRYTITTHRRLSNVLDTLDDSPALWSVYGPDVRMALDDAWDTILALRGEHIANGTYHIPARVDQVKLRDMLWETRPHACAHCGYVLTRPITRLHHIVPVSQGGTNDGDNLLLLCANCHAIAHAAQYDK